MWSAVVCCHATCGGASTRSQRAALRLCIVVLAVSVLRGAGAQSSGDSVVRVDVSPAGVSELVGLMNGTVQANASHVNVMLQPGIYNFSDYSTLNCGGSVGRKVRLDGNNRAVLALNSAMIYVQTGADLELVNLVSFRDHAGTQPRSGSGNRRLQQASSGSALTGFVQIYRSVGANLTAYNLTIILPFDCVSWNGIRTFLQDTPASLVSSQVYTNAVTGSAMMAVDYNASDGQGGYTDVHIGRISCDSRYWDYILGLMASNSSLGAAAEPQSASVKTAASHHARNVAAIVAGVVGGVAVATLAVAAAVVFVQRRRRSGMMALGSMDLESCNVKLPRTVDVAKSSTTQGDAKCMGAAVERKLEMVSRGGGGSAAPSSSDIAAAAGMSAGTSDAASRGATSLPSGADHSAASAADGSCAEEQPTLSDLKAAIAAVAESVDGGLLEIMDVIGRGGFGVVYKARWRGLNVAVKTVNFQVIGKAGLMADANARRIINEAAITFTLSHPNIVNTYSHDIKPLMSTNLGKRAAADASDSSTADDTQQLHSAAVDWRLILVQEFCDGGTLRGAIARQWLHADHRANMRVVVKVAEDIALGIQKIHSQNIIHGDLNPTNILLKLEEAEAAGNDGRRRAAVAAGEFTAKVADFGLSLKMAAQQTHVSLAGHGTPFYIAPEVVKHRRITQASDIYSFGVIMWELYHGTTPYVHTEHGVVLHSTFPKFDRSCPVQYAVLVTACMRRNVDERPTCDSVLHVLRLLKEKLMPTTDDAPPAVEGARAMAEHSTPQPLSSTEAAEHSTPLVTANDREAAARSAEFVSAFEFPASITHDNDQHA